MNAALRSLPRKRAQHGQSTTEFVVLALVLLPLALLIPALGKYGDLAQQTTQASRYVAFEQAVRGEVHLREDDAVLAETRRRVMGTSQAPVKAGDVAGDNWRDRNPLWTDTRGAPLLPRFADGVQGEAARSSRSGLPGSARFLGRRPGYDLPQDRFFTARVVASPQSLPGIAGWNADNGLNLVTQRRTAIMTDPWTASGPAEVSRRVTESRGEATAPPWDQPYPIEALRLLNETVGRVPPLLLENGYRISRGPTPAPPALNLEHNADVVPCDRLQPRPAGCR